MIPVLLAGWGLLSFPAATLLGRFIAAGQHTSAARDHAVGVPGGAHGLRSRLLVDATATPPVLLPGRTAASTRTHQK